MYAVAAEGHCPSIHVESLYIQLIPRPSRQHPVPTVLITDPTQRAALAAARSLGAAGWTVRTIGAARGLAGVSRYTRTHHRIGVDDEADPHRFRLVVTAAVRAAGIDLILPVTDRASRALLGRDEELGSRVAGPSYEAYLRASDKALLLDAARSCDITVPRQYALEGPDDPLPPLPDGAVVKPAHSSIEVDGRHRSTSVSFADTEASLRACITRYVPEAFPLLIQERIVGEGVGVFLLRLCGSTRLVFGHRRLREKPPAGGVSTYREAIDPPRELVQRCEQLLDQIGYAGAAMVEFKYDPARERYVLMEINARLWGSVQLAVDAGVDFPLALAESALGLPLSAARACKPGVRTIWELGELDHALAMIRYSPTELHLPPGSRSGIRPAVRAITDHRAGDRLEVFRANDPLPFGAELLRWLGRR
jgi:predicted ATP-grasp superfamily ATP-dependent carboligase